MLQESEFRGFRTLPTAQIDGPKNPATLLEYVEQSWRNGADSVTTDLAESGVEFIRLLRGEFAPSDTSLRLSSTAAQLGNAAASAGFEHDDIMTAQRILFEKYALEIPPSTEETEHLQWIMLDFAKEIGLELDMS